MPQSETELQTGTLIRVRVNPGRISECRPGHPYEYGVVVFAEGARVMYRPLADRRYAGEDVEAFAVLASQVSEA